ncbi:MAG: agmatine deiminase [Desulfuromonas sp.]|nr:MAG: agmatine deiminase [Desulfuromonas sp.]
MNQTAIRLPAEWEPQDAVLLAWPHTDSDWEPLLDEVSAVYVEIARQIVRFEQLIILTLEADRIRDQLAEAGVDCTKIHFCRAATNDTWIRDFGPITVYRDGDPELLNFGFNGWGLKFAADRDNQATLMLAAGDLLRPLPLQTCGLILEGGSIESDGEGTLLTTTNCLLNGNRNPHLNRDQLETQLSGLFGSSHWLWLEHGWLAGDDTDAHIDTLARLCPDDTILYVQCPDKDDEHYAELKAMEKQLGRFRTRTGAPFRLRPLPWPQACYDGEERLPATYANFLIINDAVLVPTYADPHDQEALTTITTAFPEREVIGIDCRPLIRQHGSLHCVTMQLPQGVLP